MLQFTELHRSRLKSLNPCSRTRRKTSRSVFHFPRRTIAAVGPTNGSRGCRYGGHSKRLGHPAKLQSIKSYRRRPFGSEFLTTKGTNIGLVGSLRQQVVQNHLLLFNNKLLSFRFGIKADRKSVV